MILVLSMLLITIIVFTCVCLRLFIRLGDSEGRIALLEIKVNYSEQSEKTLRESVDLQTKCIRDLNDIVKKSVENKEPTEPDTKALLAGWTVEEPELPKEQLEQIDSFRMQNLMNSLCYKNIFYKKAISNFLIENYYGKLNWQLKEWFSKCDSGGKG